MVFIIKINLGKITNITKIVYNIMFIPNIRAAPYIKSAFATGIHLMLFSRCLKMTNWSESHRVSKEMGLADVHSINSGGSRIFLGGGAATPKVSALIYYFYRKLHENEKKWTPGDPPMQTIPLHA